jgi:glutamine cyclotransferase
LRITLEQLKSRNNASIELMEILSLEGQSYMARLTVDGQQMILSDGRGTTQFRSTWHAQDMLSSFHILETQVVHVSAYNEMVGMEPSSVEPLRVRVQRQKP